MSYNGILPVSKVYGARSTSCVSAVKRLLGKDQKIGHAGTLDSTAQGTLVLLLGSATRLSNAVMNLPKKYVATVQLGWETDTDDASGLPLTEPLPVEVKELELQQAFYSFLGTRMQRPPRISAVRVEGVRSHRLARSGEDILPDTRPVTIPFIRYLGKLGALGQFQMEVLCHRGTYIRSLARDIGQILGTGAHLCGLERINVGSYRSSETILFDPQTPAAKEKLIAHIQPVATLAGQYCTYKANDFCERRLINGLGVYLERLELLSYGIVPLKAGIVVLGPARLCICRLANEGSRGILYPQTVIPLEVMSA